jgi:excinuclease ABC subunit C
VGPVKRRALLQAFGSLQGVKDATLEQVAALEGFSELSARRLLEGLGVLPTADEGAGLEEGNAPPPESTEPTEST